MLMKVIATKIEYETDGEEVDLPDELELEVDADCLDDVNELIADAISDETGWLVNWFDCKIISIKCLDDIERTEEEYREWIVNLVKLYALERKDLTDKELESLQNEGFC